MATATIVQMIHNTITAGSEEKPSRENIVKFLLNSIATQKNTVLSDDAMSVPQTHLKRSWGAKIVYNTGDLISYTMQNTWAQYR